MTNDRAVESKVLDTREPEPTDNSQLSANLSNNLRRIDYTVETVKQIAQDGLCGIQTIASRLFDTQPLGSLIFRRLHLIEQINLGVFFRAVFSLSLLTVTEYIAEPFNLTEYITDLATLTNVDSVR